jgi:hypothetical protein
VSRLHEVRTALAPAAATLLAARVPFRMFAHSPRGRQIDAELNRSWNGKPGAWRW